MNDALPDAPPAGLLHGVTRRNAIITAALLLGGLFATLYLARHERTDTDAEIRHEFDGSCREIQAKIENRLIAHAQVLRSSAAFFAASDTVSRSEWKIYTERQSVQQNLPGIQGLGFALVVPRAGLARHLAQIRAEGFPTYRIWPESDRDTYTSIIYLEPFFGRNLRAFGYDMATEPVRRAAMERARDEDVATLSGKVLLVQETDEDIQAGTLMYVPVYRKGAPTRTVDERRAALVGWVYSPYRMNDLISAGLPGGHHSSVRRQIRLEIFDGDTATRSALLFDSHLTKPLPPTLSAADKTTTVEWLGRRWTLRFTPTTRPRAIADYTNVWLTVFAGSVVTLLIAGIYLALANTRSRAQTITQGLTADLRKSEERHRIILQTSMNGFWVADHTGRLLEVNEAYCRMSGYTAAELRALTIADVEAVESPDETAARMKKIGEDGEARFESRHRRKDGSIYDVEVSVQYRPDEGGRWISFVHDITERKRSVAALKASETRFRAIIEASPVPMAVNDEHLRITFLNQAFVRTFGYTLEDIPTLGEWWTKAYPDHAYRAQISARWAEETERCARTATDFQPVEADVRCHDGSTRTVLATAASLTDLIAGTHLVVLHDITSRKQAEAALRESEDRHRALTESSPEAIMVHRAGKIIYANPAALKITGAATAAELVGTPLLDRVHPYFRPLVLARVAYIESGQGHAPVAEMTFLRLDGTPIEVEAQGSNIVYDGEPAVRAVVRDLTDFKRAQAALAASEANYRLLFASMLDGFALHEIICDEAGRPVDYRFLSVNPAFERLTGLRAADAVGRTVLELMPNTEAKWIERYGHVALTGEGIEFEEYSGVLGRYFEVAAFRPRPGQFATIFIDITASRRAEAALRESEERFRSYIEHAPMGVFITDETGRYVQVNAAAAHMTGYSETELLTLRVLDTLPPEAHAAGGAHFQQLSTVGQASNELPFRRKDGSIGFWLVDAVKLSSTRFLGFTVETTARKQAELALHSSLREKEALLKEVHHRVKNNLQVIMSLLRLEARRSAQPDTRAVLRDMQDRIRSMALLHESLYRAGTFAVVDLGSYLHQLAHQAFRSLVTTPGLVRLHIDLASVFVEMDQALPCGLLVNELLSNALKHGFPSGASGEVRIELHAIAGGQQWRLRVSDNGVGLPADFEARRGQSLGLQLVSDHVAQIRGRLEVGPQPAAVFTVTFAVASLRPPPPSL